MAELFRLKTTYVERQDPNQASMSYDSETDTLYIHLDVFSGLHVACYLDDGVYALFDPETMEVVGFQVENWERVFLSIHSDLKDYWSLDPDTEENKGYVVRIVQRYTPDECVA